MAHFMMAYTPAPLILAECLWLWPRVVLVRGSIAAQTRMPAYQIRLLDRSLDAAQQARARGLWWRVAGRPLAGGVFLGVEVWKLPVPMWLAHAALATAGACLAWWLVNQVRALRAGTLGGLHFAYLCSHYVIYVVAYAAISDITQGWIVINVWHNAQYIAFVWLFNSNRFKGGVEREQLAISWLSQGRNWPIYLLACLAITGVVYGGLDAASAWFTQYTTVPLVLICYQVLNFHHYIVDSLIWKLRKPAVQASLHIA